MHDAVVVPKEIASLSVKEKVKLIRRELRIPGATTIKPEQIESLLAETMRKLWREGRSDEVVRGYWVSPVITIKDV